jgi:methyl-accepting chemotaxis protein
MRNLLLDYRFQLKYTGYVMLVTAIIGGGLGFMVYESSTEVSQMLELNVLGNSTLAPEEMERLLGEAAAYDEGVLVRVIGGVLFLLFSIGITGIFITHRVVGPAYRIRVCLDAVAEGKLRLAGRLRKGDELQDVFAALDAMINSLREAQQDEIDLLTEAIDAVQKAGVPDEKVADIVAVRERMVSALEA